MLRRQVSSIMLSLSEYVVVDRDITLAQAIAALARSRADLAPDRHPHRAVLVKGASGEIVGKLGHLAFLRALLPERRDWNSGDMLDQAGVSDDMKQSSAGMFGFLGEEFVDVGQILRSVRVGDVCTAAAARIEHDASLLDATRAFLASSTLSLLVTERGRTIGILRLADLFDEIARQAPLDDGA